MQLTIIIGISIVAVAVFLAFASVLLMLMINQQSVSSTNPTPTPTPQPSKNIAISYSTEKVPYIVGQFGVDYPNSDKLFLEVNMTIKNNGYDSFSTNPLWFSVVVENVKYGVDSETYIVNNWDTVDVLNGGIFKGTLVFQIPSTATSFTLGYEGFLVNYNIIWTKVQ